MCDLNVKIQISENDDDNKDKDRRYKNLVGAALVIILYGIVVCFFPLPGPFCHDVGKEKLAELNNTVNKVGNEVLVKIGAVGFLVSVTPLLIQLFTDSVENYKNSKNLLTTILLFIVGCTFGYDSILMFRYFCVLAVKSSPESSQFDFSDLYSFIKSNFLKFVPGFALILLFFLHVHLTYKNEPKIKDQPVGFIGYLKFFISLEFLYSLIGGAAIGALCLYSFDFGVLVCFFVVFHKFIYQLRNLDTIRKDTYSKTKDFMLQLFKALGTLSGVFVVFLMPGAGMTMKSIQYLALIYLTFPCLYELVKFLYHCEKQRQPDECSFLSEIKGLIGAIPVVLAAGFAEPKSVYFINYVLN